MKNVYQLPISKQKQARISIPIPEPEPLPDEEAIGLVQGQEPGSKEEWRVSVALDYWKIGYIYQYEIFDYPFAGSQKIDFWCFTPILPTPLFVQGLYWHGGLRTEESKYKVWKVSDRFRGQIFDPVEIWDYEIQTIDAAIQVVRARLRI